ncbi:MAG: LamG-like jellyroll fold domain-containing protein [Flavobacterium sp.]
MKKSLPLKLLLMVWMIFIPMENVLSQLMTPFQGSNSFEMSLANTFNLNGVILGHQTQNIQLSLELLAFNIGNSQIQTQTFLLNSKWKVSSNQIDTPLLIHLQETVLNHIQVPEESIPVFLIADDENLTENLNFIQALKYQNQLYAKHSFVGDKYVTLGFANKTITSGALNFNGMDDFIRFESSAIQLNSFTISKWIKPSPNEDSKTIVQLTNGAHSISVQLNASQKIILQHKSSQSYHIIESNTAIPYGQWHQLTVTYHNGIVKIYIDGVLDHASQYEISSFLDFDQVFVGAEKSIVGFKNYYKGSLDELKIWNVALNESQIRISMNQEIEKKGRNHIKGVSWNENDAFKPFEQLRWNQIQLYLNMNQFVGRNILDHSNHQRVGYFSNPTSISIEEQTAPIPYQSQNAGNWFDATVWKNGEDIALPCSPSIVDSSVTIDWNIVEINHNIHSSGNKTLSGLMVNQNTLFAENDSKIEVSQYLKINGKIDLVGRSQLIQPQYSYLDSESSGTIERDQQGTSNRFNYNYWCSPVSTPNNTSVNHGHTVSGVLRDGTNPNNPIPLAWTSNINPPSTTNPVTLSSYWIFRFQNMTPVYANWTGAGINGLLQAGHGFTMKGSNQPTAYQNYVFVGKPNNGKITSQIAPNNLNLTGNPYPSALDAHQFIKDNINSITGSLYFWEHFETNNTHNLAGYQGGYAMVNLVGGIKPKVPQEISQSGSSDRIPGRFVPVGQGFMVYGSTTGGPIEFDNHQRAFIRESHEFSNSMFRMTNNTESINFENNNQEDIISEDPFKKIRLNITLPNGFERQLLAGYMNQWATSGFDRGFDAPILDNQDNEAYFRVANFSLAILGEGYFGTDKIHSIGIKSTQSGLFKIQLAETEHFEENINIYVFDQLLNHYHDLKVEPYQVEINQGTLDHRFSLRYSNPNALSNNQFDASQSIIVFHSQDDRHIHIKNNHQNDIKSVEVYNLLGQLINQKPLNHSSNEVIKINANGLSSGTYLVNVITEQFTSSKKIIIK